MTKRGYINIPEWIIDLELDVYEMIIMAIIYGFSQDGESCFSGGQSYLAKRAKCTTRKVRLALTNLLNKEYISKRERMIGNIKTYEYRVGTIFLGAECHSYGVEYYSSGVECGSSNNKDIININNNTTTTTTRARESFVKPSLQEVTEYLAERNSPVDAESFFAYYESNGWMVGRNKMKSWKAAVTTWEKKERERKVAPKERERTPARKESTFEHSIKEIDAMFGGNTWEQLYGNKQ